jgi:hypothetical protein
MCHDQPRVYPFEGTFRDDEGDFLDPFVVIHCEPFQMYACKAMVDMFHLPEKDFCPQVDKVLTVGDLYELSAGIQIIFNRSAILR